MLFVGGVLGVTFGAWIELKVTMFAGALILIGILMSKYLVITRFLYGVAFKRTLQDVSSGDWVSVELWPDGDQRRLLLVPDQCGIIVRGNQEVHVHLGNGAIISGFTKDLYLSVDSSTRLPSLSICKKETSKPLSNYRFAPPIVGGLLSVNLDLNMRLMAFSHWIGVTFRTGK